MRVVVTGATGNVGTAVLRVLDADPGVDEIVAVARRNPRRSLGRAEFVSADVSTDPLESVFAGADAVVHLAWLIQPGRDESVTARVNLHGSRQVFDAVVAARVPSLIYASSVGAYSPGPKDQRVDESWPTHGIPSSFYSRHKAAVERDLDRLGADQPGLRIVRLRPGLIFQRSAATEIRRLFARPTTAGEAAALTPGAGVARLPGSCIENINLSTLSVARAVRTSSRPHPEWTTALLTSSLATIRTSLSTPSRQFIPINAARTARAAPGSQGTSTDRIWGEAVNIY